MKYLKVFENFQKTYTDLINDVKETAKKHGVKLILPESETVKYNGIDVCGYFIDNGEPTFACAIGSDLKLWTTVFAHESSHMDQWIEGSKFWKENYYKGKEAVDWLDEWCQKKIELDPSVVDEIIERAIGVELDCERRTIEKEKLYNLPVDIIEEIQKAISYILFYRFLKDSRRWNTVGKSPYLIEEVWRLMPKSFDDLDFKTVPENIKEAYYKYCY